MLLILAQ
jgi:hypothetical protein